jgi:hypothetical protein
MADRKALVSTAAADPYLERGRGAKPVKEVWQLLEYLMANGGGVDGLWADDLEFDEVLAILEVSHHGFRQC